MWRVNNFKYKGVECKLQLALLGHPRKSADDLAIKDIIDFYRLTDNGHLLRYTMICGGVFVWALVVPSGEWGAQRTIAQFHHEQNGHCGSDITYIV